MRCLANISETLQTCQESTLLALSLKREVSQLLYAVTNFSLHGFLVEGVQGHTTHHPAVLLHSPLTPQLGELLDGLHWVHLDRLVL